VGAIDTTYVLSPTHSPYISPPSLQPCISHFWSTFMAISCMSHSFTLLLSFQRPRHSNRCRCCTSRAQSRGRLHQEHRARTGHRAAGPRGRAHRCVAGLERYAVRVGWDHQVRMLFEILIPLDADSISFPPLIAARPSQTR
jgi:hypothetical protein